LHVEKFAINKQILIRERWFPDDVGDVTSKDTLISLKLIDTSLLINFTTEHVVLAMSLYETTNALQYRQAVSVTNVVARWTSHVNMLALGHLACLESLHGLSVDNKTAICERMAAIGQAKQ